MNSTIFENFVIRIANKADKCRSYTGISCIWIVLEGIKTMNLKVEVIKNKVVKSVIYFYGRIIFIRNIRLEKVHTKI